MSTDLWFPLQRITDDSMNDADLIGRMVFRARQSTSAQNITSGGDTAANAIQWQDIDLDLLGGWNGGQPTRWTAPRAGWWELSGGVSFAGSTAGQIRECVWYVGGSAISGGRGRPTPNSAITASALTAEARTIPVQLGVGGYVELIAAQNSGGNLATFTGSYSPYISITYAGPST
ncbi:hypothetical protein [Streptomyces sp. NPDC018693]|uniref:hypothetical protein n=1 Tax=unclassified Streptomyces TaxID=2593676 RepID=UPI0037ABAF88